jgi:hypothetical protein
MPAYLHAIICESAEERKAHNYRRREKKAVEVVLHSHIIALCTTKSTTEVRKPS